MIVAIGGLAVIAVGGYQAYKGLAKKFLEESQTERMSSETRKTFTALGFSAISPARSPSS